MDGTDEIVQALSTIENLASESNNHLAQTAISLEEISTLLKQILAKLIQIEAKIKT